MPQADRSREVLQALLRGSDTPMVRRMFQDQPQVLNLPGGRQATHLMATAEVDGQHIAFPTVAPDKHGKMTDFGMGEQAVMRALLLDDYIPFSSAEQAEFFSQNYKTLLPGETFR